MRGVESVDERVDLRIRVLAGLAHEIESRTLALGKRVTRAEVRRNARERVVALKLGVELRIRRGVARGERREDRPAHVRVEPELADAPIEHRAQAFRAGGVRGGTERRDGRAGEDELGIGARLGGLEQIPQGVREVRAVCVRVEVVRDRVLRVGERGGHEPRVGLGRGVVENRTHVVAGWPLTVACGLPQGGPHDGAREFVLEFRQLLSQDTE